MSDLRDTSAFTRTVDESSKPIQVMKGRERKMVVLSNALHERYERLERRLSFKATIAEAEADTKAGRVRPMTDVQARMREKYGA
ncbi:MAG: hypothetical protein IJ087_09825 [Eggerthellaceae bacterium]|nr:hypothetical protein [Eggerthellaceae bacterium]